MTSIVPGAADAIAHIRDGSRVVVPPGSASPSALLAALGDREWAAGIDLYCSAGRLPRSILENPAVRVTDWQLAGGARALHDAGRIDYVPLRYSDFPRAFGLDSPLRPDVLLTQIPPPTADGRLSPGLCAAIGFDIIHDVPLVIAEYNDALPWTHSSVDAGESAVDVAVNIHAPLATGTRDAPSPAEEAVARNVASLVVDGATLQFGTGSVVEACLALLANHRNLGIHSGMVTGGIQALLEGGAISNAGKGYLDGYTVAGMVHGPPAFMTFIDRNPEFLVVPAAVSHGPDVIFQLRNFTTVNSAIEVDLTGQVNAESLDGSQFSGVGGQADYTFAGSTSLQPGCRSIIAMPSTTRDGSLSRIVPRLALGAVVTTPRYCVDFVVTEHGVADLRFRDLRQRAAALIAVAAPQHRETLERSLFEQHRVASPLPATAP